ncbi:peptidyl-prolyl cis-trans isomerase [Sphingobium sp. AS12]|uniref:peptidylprolyl isomerase n=1 Tax=Sphingobium sp. AS12 TaxID=2849495 RepID=UPI001C31AE22|nr:peptidylprolyl isomerase [Sphingobium sp. AS12]MBV2150743.1 peptidyl-prolyl cis-trans isomerase [Sphingobium sp. AS12]
MATKAMMAAPSARAPRLRVMAGKAIRDPLVAFMAVGVALFGGYHIIEREQKPPVIFTPQVEQAMVGEYETLVGRPATAADKARIKRDYLAEELLFREAIDRNMHLTDGETRKRLVDKVRYLIAGAPPEPTDEQLVNHYSDNLAQYRAEPRTSFTQIYRAQKPADAALLLAQLNAGETIAGDDFWLGRAFPLYGDSMVRGIFGQPFVATLKTAPEGRWFGPVRSPRGWHFVRKSESIASAMIPFPAIRDQVRQDYMIAHSNAAIDKALAGLKEKYDVED